jgi:F-type H+-transporting ATPase subunit delta
MADTQPDDTLREATGNKARLARVYAEALLATATRANLADTIGDELAAVADGVLKPNPEIVAFFDSAAISRGAKLPIIGTAFEKNASDLFKKFLGVLNQNGRLGLIRDIAAAYAALRDVQANRIRIKVRTASPLNDAQLESLRSTLATTLKQEPILAVTVEPELLGGLVVQIGDRVYDTSVKSRLETLRTHLMTSGSHVL